MGLLGEIGVSLAAVYSDFLSFLPLWMQDFLNLFFTSLILVAAGIFIWKFYRFAAKKNIIELNLNQYNRSEHPVISRAVKIGFYTLEYIIILPFLVFFWFSVFTIFLILLTENLELNTILILSATIIAAVRMTAYYKEDVSKEIAKLLPYTLLGVALTRGGALSITKIIEQAFEIPSYFSHITSYILFIFIIEFILRMIETAFVASGIEDPEEAEVPNEELD